MKFMSKEISLPSVDLDIRTKIMVLAWPAILENLLTTLIQFVNTAMVSHLGSDATAAVGINTPLIWMINGIVTSVGVGATALVARYIGAGDKDKARRVSNQSILIGIFLGIVFTFVILLLGNSIPIWLGADSTIAPLSAKYIRIMSTTFILYFASLVAGAALRGAGNTKTPMRINVLMNIINIIGNFILIYPSRTLVLCRGFELPMMGSISIPKIQITLWGANLGIEGAAISTALSQGIAGIIFLIIMFNDDCVLKLRLKELFSLDMDLIEKILYIGVPAAGERIIVSSGQMAFTKIIAGLGTVQLAAHYLANTAESISYMPAYGLAVAATTLVGQSLGVSDTEKAERYGYGAFKIGVLIMSSMAFVFMFFPQYLIRIFTNDPVVIYHASSVLRIEALAQPFFASSIILSGALRGAGDTTWPLYISIISMWGVRIILAWIMVGVFGLGLKSAWSAMVADLAVRGIFIFIRYRNGKWKSIVLE